jgi:hypothetical protein
MQRANFAGVEAAIGIVVWAVFWVFGMLGVIGVTALFAVGEIPLEAANIATFVGGLAVFTWWTWKWLKDFRLVRVVEIDDHNNWILKSVFGIERGRLGPMEAREFAVYEAHRWVLVGAIRKMKVSWAEITAGNRHWKTTQNPPASQQKAIETLRGWIRSRS